jgi:hypothetical protein
MSGESLRQFGAVVADLPLQNPLKVAILFNQALNPLLEPATLRVKIFL